jgi:L-fucose mutarotase
VPTIWEDYRRILQKSGAPWDEFEFIERFAFYERAKDAYAIIATSEGAQYANLILKKGVL